MKGFHWVPPEVIQGLKETRNLDPTGTSYNVTTPLPRGPNKNKNPKRLELPEINPEAERVRFSDNLVF